MRTAVASLPFAPSHYLDRTFSTLPLWRVWLSALPSSGVAMPGVRGAALAARCPILASSTRLHYSAMPLTHFWVHAIPSMQFIFFIQPWFWRTGALAFLSFCPSVVLLVPYLFISLTVAPSQTTWVPDIDLYLPCLLVLPFSLTLVLPFAAGMLPACRRAATMPAYMVLLRSWIPCWFYGWHKRACGNIPLTLRIPCHVPLLLHTACPCMTYTFATIPSSSSCHCPIYLPYIPQFCRHYTLQHMCSWHSSS